MSNDLVRVGDTLEITFAPLPGAPAWTTRHTVTWAPGRRQSKFACQTAEGYRWTNAVVYGPREPDAPAATIIRGATRTLTPPAPGATLPPVSASLV